MESNDRIIITGDTPVSELMHTTTEEIKEDASDNELQHWGIKGMRWGVRRYQNKDGSLTAAGEKRRKKLQGKLDELNGQPTKNSGKTTKKISEMDDDELSKYIGRKNAEKMAYILDKDISSLNPKKVSFGDKIKKEFSDKAASALAESGKKALSGIMDKLVDKVLGTGSSDALYALKKQAEKADLEKRIAESAFSKNKVKIQEQQFLKNKTSDSNTSDSNTSNSGSGNKKESLFSKIKDRQNSKSNNSRKSRHGLNDEYDFDDRVYTGTVEGSGSSSRRSTSSNSSRYSTVVDAEWSSPADSYSNSYSSSGSSYVSSDRVQRLLNSPVSNVAGYLPPPKDDDD